MKKDTVKHSFLLSCTFLGAVIGAGFASGKELVCFFLPFDKSGIWGILISCIVLSLCFYSVTRTVGRNNIKNTYDYLVYIANPFFGRIIYAFVYAFAFVIFCAMLAGSGALFKQTLSLPYAAGSFFMCAVCIFTFRKNIYGILNANAYLAPAMIFGIFYIGISVLFKADSVFYEFRDGAKLVCSAFVYSSYNSVSIISVFCEMGDMLKNKKVPVISSVFSAAALFVISLVLYAILLAFKSDAMEFELPILKIAGSKGMFYSVIMFFAMLTTAVSSLFSLIKFFENEFGAGINCSYFICLAAFLCSLMGFSKMVSAVYPLFGYLGIFLIVYINAKFLSDSVKIKHKKFKNQRNRAKIGEKQG